jgi:hypothetical protein
MSTPSNPILGQFSLDRKGDMLRIIWNENAWVPNPYLCGSRPTASDAPVLAHRARIWCGVGGLSNSPTSQSSRALSVSRSPLYPIPLSEAMKRQNAP